jgi:hypothetical protein
VGQEFFIKSADLESKVRELLPSQGGLGAGFDLTASTQIIPIVDLTESAEGSNVRQDLQTAISFNDVTTFAFSNTTTTIVSNTGYFRIFGTVSAVSSASSASGSGIRINDGASTKDLFSTTMQVSSNLTNVVTPFDFIAFLPAGHIMEAVSTSANMFLAGITKQIATIDGTLTSPS